MPGKIYYAVIALTKTQADEVISELKKNGKDSLVKWLEENKEQIYGELIDDWKPFKDKKIKDIIIENSKDIFESETHCISDLDSTCPEVGKIKHIQIFFIDLFAMFIKKYETIAKYCDLAFDDAKRGKCCFLISYKVPSDIQEQLEKKYKETWKNVSNGYIDGCLHRIAVRVDDINNFKNIIKTLSENRPHPSADGAADEFLGSNRALAKL